MLPRMHSLLTFTCKWGPFIVLSGKKFWWSRLYLSVLKVSVSVEIIRDYCNRKWNKNSNINRLLSCTWLCVDKKQLKNKRKPTRSLHWGTVMVRLPVLLQCGFMSSSGRLNRFYTRLFIRTGRSWLYVAFIKAPTEDTRKSRRRLWAPLWLKWLAKMLQLRFFCRTWLKV